MLGLGEGKQRDKGVTIIELAVVMAIIAIIALFMSPALGEWATRFRVRGASKDLADALQLARLKAISDVVEYKVELDLDNQRFSVWKGNARQGSTSWPTQEGATITLPRTVAINNVDGTTSGTVDRVFRPNGSASGFANTTSVIFVENESNDRYRVIISQTGVIRMTEGWGG
jgi:prepilin-type N-terminal cleavage/methylation domain-containing protein